MGENGRSMRKLVFLMTILTALACAKRETPATKAPAAEKGHGFQTQTQASATETTATAAGQTVDVGTMMPAYTARMFDGKLFDLAGERGNVVFLNLWATWCGPCRYEIPELQSMHQKYASRGFKVIGVSLDDTGIDSVKQFVTQHGMTYPVVYDPEGKIAAIFQSSVLPTSVIVDRSGHVVWKKFGVVSMEDASLMAALNKALDAKS
jgi:cytochrome c biogenesis protein CcmG, thiol:disulfide interchange protein DsbE